MKLHCNGAFILIGIKEIVTNSCCYSKKYILFIRVERNHEKGEEITINWKGLTKDQLNLLNIGKLNHRKKILKKNRKQDYY